MTRRNGNIHYRKPATGTARGASPLIVGWGQAEDRIHSPNESYSFKQFSLARTWAKAILEAI